MIMSKRYKTSQSQEIIKSKFLLLNSPQKSIPLKAYPDHREQIYKSIEKIRNTSTQK